MINLQNSHASVVLYHQTRYSVTCNNLPLPPTTTPTAFSMYLLNFSKVHLFKNEEIGSKITTRNKAVYAMSFVINNRGRFLATDDDSATNQKHIVSQLPTLCRTVSFVSKLPH